MSRGTTASDAKIAYPVQLREGHIENASDLVNLIFEYAVFFRWIYFKNRPRGNLLFIRALMIVGFYSSLFVTFRHDLDLIIMGIDVDPAIVFGSMVVVGYWNMIHAFYTKSSACNRIYLEMIKEGGGGNTQTARLLSNSLAIELLTMDLWAHRRYRMLFARNLFRAVEHAYSPSSRSLDFQLPGTETEMYELVNRGKLQAKEARSLLENYQEYLIYSANQKFGQSAA